LCRPVGDRRAEAQLSTASWSERQVDHLALTHVVVARLIRPRVVAREQVHDLRPAIHAVKRRAATLEVTLEISPGRLGHAFPTGDMFRQVELTVRLGDEEQRVRIFAQTITADASGHRLGQVDDTRVLAGQRWRRRLRFGGHAAGAKVRWTLTLLRLDPEVARRRALPAELVRVPIAAGELVVPAR
jgi:hypothetical protein